MIRRRAVALGAVAAFLAALVPANAQYPGQIPTATVLGNASGAPAPAKPITAGTGILITGGAISVNTSSVQCGTLANTAVVFGTGASTCTVDTPNFTYSSVNGQLAIINKQTTTMDPHAPAALVLEAPDVNIHGAIQVGQSNVSGSGGWGMWGYSDVGGYTYLNTGDASPIMLGSSLGATRTGINFTGCMIADIQCGHGDLQISGHRQDFEAGSNYWALAVGDGAALMGGFKLDTSGYPILQWGDSETSNFVPHIHIALNGNSYFNGIGGTNYVGFGTTSPGTQVDVNGDITTRTVTSCNGANSAVQTNASGKIVCGTISGGGGGVTASGSMTNHAPVFATGASSVNSTAAMTNGQVLIGSTGADPVPASISAGAGITITPGAGTISIASSGGGAGNGLYQPVMSAVPTASSTGLTTSVNLGTATVNDGPTGYSICGPTNTNQIEGKTKAAPGTPYNIDIALEASAYSVAAGFGPLFGWTDGTKLQVFELAMDNGTASLDVLDYATTGSGGGAANIRALIYNGHGPGAKWLRISDDGTTVSFSILPGGDHTFAKTVYSVAKASGYLANYDTIFYGINAHNGNVCGTILSYTQR